MLTRTLTIRRVTVALALTAAIATLTSPQALADGTGRAPLQAAHYDGRSPDTKDAAYAAHHGNRAAFAALTTNSTTAWPPLNGVGYDGRSPDTRDAAAQTRAPTTTNTRVTSVAGGNF